jgi:hypothetical protein
VVVDLRLVGTGALGDASGGRTFETSAGEFVGCCFDQSALHVS